MARPIWTGIISFGLLNVPVSVHSAVKSVDLHFRMLDSRDNKPIRYERVNAETGKEVPWKDIIKAFEYQKGNYVVLEKEDFDAVAPQGKETIEIENFVSRSAINPMFYEKPYFLAPGKKAEKGFVLLRETLRDLDRVGVGYVIIRARRYLAMVMPQDDALILNLLRFPQEVIATDELKFPNADLKALRITPKEMTMAAQLVESMTADWNPTNYTDDYRERLSEVVEKRLAHKENLVKEDDAQEDVPENAATNVVDFMALLKKSIDKSSKPGKTVSKTKTPTKTKAKVPTKPSKPSSKAKTATDAKAHVTARSKKAAS